MFEMNSGTLIGVLKRLNVYKKKRKDWTSHEEEIIREYYPGSSKDEILSLLPGRKWESINTYASQLGVKRDTFFWELDEIKYLQENYGVQPLQSLVEHYGGKFSKGAIKTKAQKLGLTKSTAWSDQENEIFIENYSLCSPSEMQQLLPRRSIVAIKNKAASLGIKSGANQSYTESDIEFIRNNYLRMDDSQIALCIGRSKFSVKNKRHELDLHRPTHSLENSVSEYIRAHNYKWKNESMKKANFRCVITGDIATDVHHRYSFNLILKEVMERCDLSAYSKCSELSPILLQKILNDFYAEQNKHGMGICLRKDMHKEFHLKYGFGNNTPDQWENFYNSKMNK